MFCGESVKRFDLGSQRDRQWSQSTDYICDTGHVTDIKEPVKTLEVIYLFIIGNKENIHFFLHLKRNKKILRLDMWRIATVPVLGLRQENC